MLGLAHVQQRRHPALLPGFRQSEEGRPGGQGAPRDLHLQIKFSQREVGAGHVADQGQHHGLPEILRGQQIGPGRLGGAPEAAPQVQLPRQAGPSLGKEALVIRRLVSPRLPVVGGGHGEIGRGELERPRDHDLGPGLEDARRGDPQVVVLFEGGPDQGLELLVLEHLPPLQVSERTGILRCLRRGAPEG